MAALIAKQMVDKQLSNVQTDIGGQRSPDLCLSAEERAQLEEQERERVAAIAEAEEVRKRKHQKIEEEREKLRQSLRDKYGIQKKKKRHEEEQIAKHLAAMNPQNPQNQMPRSMQAHADRGQQSSTTKLTGKMSNWSQMTSSLANKWQSVVPTAMSLFK